MKIRIESISELDSPYYKYLLEYPPENVIFMNRHKKTLITETKKFKRRIFIKKMLRKFLEAYNFIKIKKLSVPEIIDIIHSARTLLITDKPYVLDFEHFWVLSFSSKSSYSKLGRIVIRRLFKKKNLKFILPWTFSAYNTIPKEIREDKEIRNKIKVIYPAVPPQKFKKDYNEISLLFVARYFHQKGGITVLKVFKRLYNKYKDSIRYIIVSPYKISSEKYSFITWYDLINENKLKEIYEKSHIYVYPGYSDTFGFTILEAMSFGLPVITSRAFARDEIVSNGINGYIIDRKRNEVEEYVKRISELIEDESLLKEMSKNAVKEIERGKFSIKTRNKLLREIYENSLKY